jgi:hypothetical protein
MRIAEALGHAAGGLRVAERDKSSAQKNHLRQKKKSLLRLVLLEDTRANRVELN